MPIPAPLSRIAAVGTLGVSLTGSALAIAPSAQAADTSTTEISCSAVKVRTSPSKTASVKGIAYKGDKMTYNQWVYKASQRSWYTKGVVKRRSDGAEISGYVIYQFANPYGTNGAPTPPIPK
ncbi:hypothetical protein [Streptomyces europaeiscabiei]|uniref:hypothetical protein n=1 Tax=Streptomyces europaeiscabiei TaxID=146819 RepID=UPI0038F63821